MDSSPFVRDPLGEACREFEAVLNRLEEAVTGYNADYGPMENQADLAIVYKFVNGGMWDCLDHAQQQHYRMRVVSLQRKGRGQTT